RAEPAAAAIDHLPGPLLETGVPAQELPLALAREEAEVLALGAARHLEVRAGCDLPDLRLRQRSQGKAKACEGARAKPGEHVRLVLGGVGSRGEKRAIPVVDDPGVVPGGEPGGAEALR